MFENNRKIDRSTIDKIEKLEMVKVIGNEPNIEYIVIRNQSKYSEIIKYVRNQNEPIV